MEAIEKKKTIISNLFYIIGSAIAPELMPVEMYGKQRMPDKNRRRYEQYNSEIIKLRGDAENGRKMVREFMPLLANITQKILSSDESILYYLKSAIDAYKENESRGKYYNTVFLMYSFLKAGYLEDAVIRNYLRHGVSFPNSTFQEKLAEFNEWYVKTYGNGVKQK